MTTEAATAGFYHSPIWNKDYPKLQILTIADLLSGVEAKKPPTSSSTTLKQAEKAETEEGIEQAELF